MSTLALVLPFEFAQPAWLWLCLLVPVLIVASLRTLSGLDPTRRVSALIARSLLVLLLACCLARIERVRRNEDVTVIFLMDRSHSVRNLEDFQEDFIARSSKDVPPNDRLGMIDFARDAYLEQLPMAGGYFVPPGRLPAIANPDRTNVAAALRLAMAMFPHDTAKRIVLMSDGNDNMGDLLTEARRARSDGIPVDVVPLRYQHRNEIYFDRMIAPTQAEPGELVPIRMVIKTQRRASGSLSIYHNGKLVEVSPEEARVDLSAGSNPLVIRLPLDQPGAHTFEAVFRPDDESMDATAINNKAGAFTFVSGAGKALLISTNPEHDMPLVLALQSERVKIDLINADQLGEFGLLEMMNYSTIILANVPAAVFTEQQQEQFASYVKDMGSGLIMLGGDEGFGAGGWIGSPIEEVMPVSFELKHKRVIPRGALVLIMHSCEIPRGQFWGKEMAKKSVDTISSKDYLGVLTYTYSPGGENWEVPLDLNSNKQGVKAKIDRMQMGDMPDFAATMRMAFKELTQGRGRDAAQKHVIILSDGDASPPSQRLLTQYKNAKITVSTIGIGWGAHMRMPPMKRIANATGGKFYAARNPRALPQIFVKESKVVRRSLIIDQPFQPSVMHSYSELLGGINPSDGIPQLGGMVLTSPKRSPNVIIPLVRATKDGDDPVLAHWQYELGKTVAFASGYWPAWGQSWTQWAKFAKLWAQIVRWTMRQDMPANFDVYTKVEGSRGRIVIDALDKDASYLNLMQLRSRVLGPDNRPLDVEFEQTGPGHYEAAFDIERAGQYLANVQVADATGESLGTIRTGLSVPFSPEYRDLIPNESLLRKVAEDTGGRWLDMEPEQADVFSHDLPPTESKRPAWEWVLAWLLLPVFLLDVAVRRLANWLAFSLAVEIVLLVVMLFGLGMIYGPWWGVFGAFLLAEVVGWAIRFRYIGPLFEFMTHTVAALGHTGERSTAALEKLRTRRDEVREGLSSQQGKKKPADESAPVSADRARQRFDVGDVQAGKPAADIQDALGGAKSEAPEATPKQPGKSKDESEEGDMTSRLLRARKRAKKDQNDQN